MHEKQPLLENHTALFSYRDFFSRAVILTRSQLFIHELHEPLMHSSAIDKETAEEIVKTFRNAQLGFSLAQRMDQYGQDLHRNVLAVTTPTFETDANSLGQEIGQGEITEKAKESLISFYLVSKTVADLSKRHTVSFFDFELPRNAKRLGEMEDFESHWDIPTNAEGMWRQMIKLRKWSEQFVYSNTPLEEDELLSMSHLVTAAWQMLDHSTRKHILY